MRERCSSQSAEGEPSGIEPDAEKAYRDICDFLRSSERVCVRRNSHTTAESALNFQRVTPLRPDLPRARPRGPLSWGFSLRSAVPTGD